MDTKLASAAEESSRDRRLAVAAQAGFLVMPILMPLVIRLSARDRPFVNHYATEALNLQLFYWVSAFGAVGLSTTAESAFFPAISYLVVGYLYSLTVTIVGSTRAEAGVCWRYPINVRVVRRQL
jgi:uncharacterized Tic20 family protein